MRNNRFLAIFGCCFCLIAFLSWLASSQVATKESFRNIAVPAQLLSFGETGKILNQLDSLAPYETAREKAVELQNPLEIIQRAREERRKWLLTDSYKKHKSDIFLYLEISPSKSDSGFRVVHRFEGNWIVAGETALHSDRSVYPFFIKNHGSKIDLQFETINNDTEDLSVGPMVFLQDGYHPLVFSDQLGFNNFLRAGTRDGMILDDTGIHLPPREKVYVLRTTLIFKSEEMTGISKFQKKQGDSRVKMIPLKDHPLHQSGKQDSAEFAASSYKGLPILDIRVEQADLDSKEYGILSNPTRHGRPWERVAYVNYYRDGASRFDTFCGIRLQGGDPGREKGLINFRLFFREEYGQSNLPPETLFAGDAGKIKRIAVKQSEWQDWPLNSVIAYDISRRVGALAPPTELTLLYLNGKKLGLYYLVPHLGEKQIAEILPPSDYRYYRWRGTLHKADKLFFLESFWIKLKDVPEMTEEYATSYFDLDNLSALLFSYMFNATGDYCQGVALQGDQPDDKLFWFAWDMDHSYVDVPTEIKQGTTITQEERSEAAPSFNEFFTKPRKRKKACPRVHFFRHLVTDDPDYRAKVKKHFLDTINHRLDNDYLDELLGKYKNALHQAEYAGGDKYIDDLDDFFKRRKQFLAEQIAEDSGTSPLLCEVTAERYPLIVEGHEKLAPFKGYYLPGDQLNVRTPGNNIITWVIGDRQLQGDSVNLTLEEQSQCQIHALNGAVK